ncbi:aldo/keto reductase [Hydrogenimonas cancrithermarum]|uniref:Aldo/keto reductase n=1 Tax=Hydrogenimonas cancrithermarum TaxID=2993563 RepID=A0ABN6WVV1_9BACT|nr:aldo/keto reductase [Hydrogenimonas cancrithermarum]BDY13191.1 aldo/keto reductase [Hydrogenimonas cancrithermarum]
MTHVNIGFGTYRISAKSPQHLEALTYAMQNGIRLFDTSANYAAGDSERAIASAIRQSGSKREELTICSKAGYIQGPLLERVRRGALEVFDLVPYQEGCYHSIHSDFLKSQLSGTLERLETNYIDTYLLHNPEYFLMHTIEKKEDVEPARNEMNRRILEAFIALEEEVQAGRIKSYGISSNSFAKTPDALHFMPYTHLIALAREAATEAGSDTHHFTTIQLPINLLETEGLKCAAWAKANGLTVLVNRPLNAFDSEGMHRLATYEKPDEYETNREKLLMAADTYSLSELRTVVTDLDSIKGKFKWPGAAEEALQRQTIPFIQGILSRIPDQQVKSAVIPLLNPFLHSYLQEVSHLCSQKTLSYLHAQGYEDAGHPIQHYALRWLINRPEIDTILLGMRKKSYVDDALTLL